MPLRRRALGGPDPINPPVKGKRARIIANSKFSEFQTEYDRAKEQYAKHYPGGVDFVSAYGYDELEKAFGQVQPDEDVIMMGHYNRDIMYGVPVSDQGIETFDAKKGQTLSSLFSGLQNKGYKGNCYLGICEGENIAKDIQAQGVNIPMFATPDNKKWFGSNTASKGNFDDFFFGVTGEENKHDTKNPYITKTINPEEGKDYKMLLSPRHQELMKRRASGISFGSVAPMKNITLKYGGKIRKYNTGGPYEDDLSSFYGRSPLLTDAPPHGLTSSVKDFDFSAKTRNFKDIVKPVTMASPSVQPKEGFDIAGGLSKVLPFASNINNALTRLPNPTAPTMEQTINPSLVNFDNDRAEADRAFRSLSKGLSQSSNNPAQTNAARVSAFSRVLEAKGKLGQAEKNANAGIINQTNQVNASIGARNVERTNSFRDELTSRRIKQQQLDQSNLSNAADKVQMSRRDNDLMELENRKLGILLATDKDTGTFDRNLYDNYIKELYPTQKFKRKRNG